MNIRLNLLLVLLLLLTLAPQAVQAAPPGLRTTVAAAADAKARIAAITQKKPTFTDDFSRNDGQWSTKSADKAVTYAYKERAFHMNIGQANFTTWRTNTQVNDMKLTDFYLEVTVNQGSGPVDGEVGVVFREVNTDNFYLFVIQQAGAYSLWKHVGQDWQAIVDWTKAPAIHTAQKANNKLGVLVEDTQIALLVNDQVLTQVQDATFAQGMIGLAAGTLKQGGLEVAFDNFKLWSLYAEPTEVQAHLQAITAADPAFSDDFHQNDGKWTTKSDDKDVSFTYKNRTLHLRVNRPKWTAWTANQTIDDLNLSDFYLEAEASQVAGPSGAEFGLLFRQVDNDNYYLFSISREGTYSLGKKVAGKWQPIVDWTKANAIQTNPNALNKLGLLAEGAQLTLFVNDQALFQLKDTALQAGTVALMTGTYEQGGAEVTFSKLNIWPLTSAAPDTPTPEITATVNVSDVQTQIGDITQNQPAFSDDFHRNNGKWTTQSDNKAVTFTYTNRTLHLRVDQTNWVTWTSNQQIDDLALSDFYLETEVALLDTPTDSQFGVNFRMVDNNNFYKFAINHTGEYSLLKNVDNKWQTVVDWTKTDAIQTAPKAKNTLGLLAEGAQLTLLVNDQVLTQVNDDTFRAGTLGLMAGTYDKGGVEVAFSKVVIWPLNAAVTDTPTPEAQTTVTETAAAETSTPEDTTTPEVTETPAVTDTAVVTDTAQAMDTPEDTTTPAVTETPAVTDTAVITDTPAETDTPAATETPTPEAVTTDTATPTSQAKTTATANGASEPIVVKPFTSQPFRTYKMRMEMKMDGQSGSQAMQGNLILETTKDVAKNQSSVLLDGSLVKSFISKQMNLPDVEIQKLTIFSTATDILVLFSGNLNVCVKAAPDDPRFSGLSKITQLGQLIDSLAGQDAKLSGALVGQATINGIQTQHYLLDAAAINKASGAAANDRLDRGEIWVALTGQYPARLTVEGPTQINNFLSSDPFSGHMTVSFDVSQVNAKLNLQLPAACQHPVALP